MQLWSLLESAGLSRVCSLDVHSADPPSVLTFGQNTKNGSSVNTQLFKSIQVYQFEVLVVYQIKYFCT